jgi:DNA-binding Lrp family transcriptional regulator
LDLNEKKRTILKDIEIRIIAELMKNSRRSDRELAQAIGSSQPTVSRTIKRLEKDGLIKEYTMIPDFERLGYQIMGVTFIGRQEPEKKEERAELRRAVIEVERKNPYASLMAVNGIGLGKGRMFITFYKDYSSYAEAMQTTKSLPHVNAENVESFLVDLNDESNYRLLTLQQIASHFQSSGKTLREKSAEKPTQPRRKRQEME